MATVDSVKRPFLTVLTVPVPHAARKLYQEIRRTARPLLRRDPAPTPAPYPGHRALVRSVVEGLRAIEADFNFNPDRMAALASVVYAPANEALEQCIALKQAGRIKWLVAGPVNAFIPTERDGTLLAPEIDTVIVASDWVRDFYAEQAPTLAAKLRVCPAGVDVDDWTPGPPAAGAGRAVVYWKSGTLAFCNQVEALVARHGYQVTRLRYGDYTADDFRHAFTAAAIGIFLSSFETQGLALAQAWAMDVPTLVWDPRAETTWRGHPFMAGSSCPYLTPATGRRWQTLDELEQALAATTPAADYAPRAWVAAHMTDAACATQLYRLIRETAAGR